MAGAARHGPVPGPFAEAAADRAAGDSGAAGALRARHRAAAEGAGRPDGDLVSRSGPPPGRRPPAPPVARLGPGLLPSARPDPGSPGRRLPRHDPRLRRLRRQRSTVRVLRPERGGGAPVPARADGRPPPPRLGRQRRGILGPSGPQPDKPRLRRHVRGRSAPSPGVVVAHGPLGTPVLPLLPHGLLVRLPVPGHPPPRGLDVPGGRHLRERRVGPGSPPGRYPCASRSRRSQAPDHSRRRSPELDQGRGRGGHRPGAGDVPPGRRADVRRRPRWPRGSGGRDRSGPSSGRSPRSAGPRLAGGRWPAGPWEPSHREPGPPGWPSDRG